MPRVAQSGWNRVRFEGAPGSESYAKPLRDLRNGQGTLMDMKAWIRVERGRREDGLRHKPQIGIP